jgi:hypothetical protein
MVKNEPGADHLLCQKEMQVNALTAGQRVKFRDLTMPEVKKIIVEKFGPEGEAMMKAFLEAVDTASK